jgi:hypothetical protein
MIDARWIGCFVVLLCACGGAGEDETIGEAVEAICPGHHGDAAVRNRVSGSNGVFVDDCDANGDLIEQVCASELIEECNDFDCSEEPQPTDVVSTVVVPCAGGCLDGVCASRCPAARATLHYDLVSMPGVAILRDVGTGVAYDCSANATFVTSEPVIARLGKTVTLAEPGWDPLHHLCLPESEGQFSIVGEDVLWSCVAK